MNTYKSQRPHIRIKYTPLSYSCELVCLTPQSPVTQSVDTTVSPAEYQPDRQATPTVVLPDIRVHDIDKVFSSGTANMYISLDSIAWTVDGKPISEVWAETDYEVLQTTDDMRGALKIYKNLPSSSKAVLHFTGAFLDWRTGVTYTVSSNDIALTCTDKGSDTISCSVDKPVIEYDPLSDNLLLYDFLVARGLTATSSRDAYKDGKCYEQVVTVSLNEGTKHLDTLPEGVTMVLREAETGADITPDSEEHPEVLSVSYPSITLDMRMIDKVDYTVSIVKDEKTLCSSSFSALTQCTMPSEGKPLSSVDLSPNMTLYENSALLKTADRHIEYPELYFLIQWYTQAKKLSGGIYVYDTIKKWQRGRFISVPLENLGIGVTYNDDFFDLFFEVSPHEPCALIADENGDILTDEEGNVIID